MPLVELGIQLGLIILFVRYELRDTFIMTLIDIAKADKNVILMTGDLGFGVLKPYWMQLPNQFINAGIAEQNMTSMAAGMAIENKIIFTYSIGNFSTFRCLEQIRNDCAYHGCNVKIISVGGGFAYGALGMSHHATEDISIMRAIPNIVVMAPGDQIETIEATKAIYQHQGTCYMRLGRGGERQIHEKLNNFRIGKALKIREGSHIVIFTTGTIADEALKAVEILFKLQKKCSLWMFPTVKPIDEDVVIKASNHHEYIITVEEHNVVGGFGSAIAEVITGNKLNVILIRIGIEDEFCSIVGDQSFLRKKHRLCADDIIKIVLEHYK